MGHQLSVENSKQNMIKLFDINKLLIIIGILQDLKNKILSHEKLVGGGGGVD